MPFASKAQQRWAYANKAKLKKQGMDVDEWSEKTDYSKLPERAKKAEFPFTEYLNTRKA
jgi:GH25 family lysozyme M1 (1,4-beta-N-acetylmuramidase)